MTNNSNPRHKVINPARYAMTDHDLSMEKVIDGLSFRVVIRTPGAPAAAR